MSFATPAALALGLLAIPIILLYLLRLRRKEQPVSSILLWRSLVRDRAANAPWQRLQRNILLLLQLLILAALVLAAARPFIIRPGQVDGNVIILLDISASMATVESGERTRFDEAVNRIEGLIDGLDGTDRMTLIAAGRTPRVLAAATDDKGLLRETLISLAPIPSEVDWPAALALAAATTPGGDSRVIIISDGGLPTDLPAVPGEVTFIPVGSAAANLAITAQGSRAVGDGTELLVSVGNFGPSAAGALLNLYADGVLYDSRRIDVPADDELALTWSLPANVELVSTQLAPTEGTADHLPLDNQAWTVLGGQTARRVLLVGEGNLFLERFFAILPGYEVIRAEAGIDEATADAGAFDLYIFDGVPLPEPLPPGHVLVIDPQASATASETPPAIEVMGTFTNTVVTRLADSPLLADVDWSAVRVAEAAAVSGATLEPLVVAEGGALLLAGEVGGRRVVVLPFDLAASDLPLQIAFPVVMANITAWLNPARTLAAGGAIQPGAILPLIPDARAESIVIEFPDGESRVRPVGAPAESILFAETEQLGVYKVAFREGSGELRDAGRFAVNFFSPAESRIEPRESVSIGQEEITPAPSDVVGRQEIWPAVLVAALGLVLLEWWVAYRPVARRPLVRTR